MKKILLIAVGLMTTTWVMSQPLAMKKFLSSDFIVEFDSIQNRAVRSVEDFKAVQHLYDEEGQARVRDAYDAAAGLFNNALHGVKKDLLDKDKRKFIRKYPEEYSKIMMTDLFVAKEYYENEYMAVITEVTDGQITGFAWLSAAVAIVKLAKKGWGMFRQAKDKWDNLNEEMINTHLIQKHRFPMWDEIQ
ncbi:MAG: hypothetical protein AAGJ18_03015 [Bacteroidota bacterium]